MAFLNLFNTKIGVFFKSKNRNNGNFRQKDSANGGVLV